MSTYWKLYPGDVITWHYAGGGRRALSVDYFWSILMQKNAHVGSKLTHVVVAVHENEMWWLNERGLFHATNDGVKLHPDDERSTFICRPRIRAVKRLQLHQNLI